MNARLVAVLAVAAAWYGLAAPRLAEAVARGRVAATESPGLARLRGVAEARGASEEARALLVEGEALLAADEAWSRSVGALLTDAQRAEGVAADVPPAQAPPHVRAIEPELWALSRALLLRHGWADVPAPPVPDQDPWRGLARARQARAVRALVEAGSLSPEVARPILVATLALLDAQARRREIEGALAEVLLGEGGR